MKRIPKHYVSQNIRPIHRPENQGRQTSQPPTKIDDAPKGREVLHGLRESGMETGKRQVPKAPRPLPGVSKKESRITTAASPSSIKLRSRRQSQARDKARVKRGAPTGKKK